MLGKIELLCVTKMDTADGNEYRAHLLCSSRDDGLAVASKIESRESISGIEFVRVSFLPTVRNKQGDYVFTTDVFIDVRDNEGIDYMDAMTNIAWEVNCQIR